MTATQTFLPHVYWDQGWIHYLFEPKRIHQTRIQNHMESTCTCY